MLVLLLSILAVIKNWVDSARESTCYRYQLCAVNYLGKDLTMEYLAQFFGAMFLVNALPHTLKGVTGQPFQSPFATPPGVGLSSPVSNVVWGGLNFIVGFVLVAKVGDFSAASWIDIAVTFAGGWLCAFALARYFGRFYGGAQQQ